MKPIVDEAACSRSAIPSVGGRRAALDFVAHDAIVV